MNREEAVQLLKIYNQEPFHLLPAYTVEGVMKYFARQDGENEEYWGLVGLLHDVDFEQYPLPLYRRKDGSYVLHRVVNFGSDGSYTMCGDNQFSVEKGITDDDVIGVVTAFYRKGKPYTVDSMKYRAYLEFMFYSKPLRKVIASTVSRSKNAFSKLKTKKGKK